MDSNIHKQSVSVLVNDISSKLQKQTVNILVKTTISFSKLHKQSVNVLVKPAPDAQSYVQKQSVNVLVKDPYAQKPVRLVTTSVYLL